MAKTTYEAPTGTKLNGKIIEVSGADYAGSTIDLTADEFKDSKASGINASGAEKDLVLKGATTFVTSNTNNTTVVSSAKADKITLGSGNDVVSITAGATGNDVITSYTASDTILISGLASSLASFTDKGASVELSYTAGGKKEKITVTRNSANTSDPINFTFVNGNTTVPLKYGVLPTDDSKYDNASKKTALTIGGGATGTVNVSQIVSTAKSIKSDNTAPIYLIGNGQANSITLGAGGGTLDGGKASDGKGGYKATADKLYGSDVADTFVVDSATSGNDIIYKYSSEQGDRIYVSDMTSTDIASVVAGTKTFKDSGKNVVVTLNKSKLTIDGNQKQVVFVGKDSKEVVYGPTLPSGVAVDSKKTTLEISKDTASDATISYAVNQSIFSANNYAPKLKAINASTFEGAVTLGSANTTIATELRAGKGGSLLIGGTNNDVLVGDTLRGTKDVFVYTVDSLKGGGKDKITYFGDSAKDHDLIKIAGYDESIHSLTLTEKKNKSFTISVNNKATGKSLGTIEVNENPNDKTILVVDDNNKIIGVNPITTPIGLTYSDSTGIKTGTDFTGAYNAGAYLIGDEMDSVNATLDHTKQPEDVTEIKASDYSAKLAVINASTISGDVHNLYIEGNDSAKNVITAPNYGTLEIDDETFDPYAYDPFSSENDENYALRTTLKGGINGADVLNGSNLTGAKDYFYVTPNSAKAKKDTFNNYDDHDVLLIEKTQNINKLSVIENDDNKVAKFDDKGSDAVLTLDKTTVTIKDGAGKKLNLALYNPSSGEVEDTLSIGHLLPRGLKYDSKKVSIVVKENATTESADVGGDSNDLNLFYGENLDSNDSLIPGNKGLISLDLRNPEYFTTIKTIDLRKINKDTPPPNKTTEVSDNSAHVTMIGSTLSNEFYSGGNEKSTAIFYGGQGHPTKGGEADKFYGSKAKDIYVYTLGDGKDVIGSSKVSDSALEAQDVIVLASDDAKTIQSKGGVFITDNGATTTIQLGTDTKKGTLTVLKQDANTPINIVLTKDSNTAMALASGIARDGLGKDAYDELALGTDYEYYYYGLRKDTLDNKIEGKTLTVGNLNDSLNDDDKAALLAENESFNINLRDISSAITNVGVTASSDITVNIIGNNNANNITLGAGGGTVDASYAVDTKGKLKATNDKLYGGSGTDIFRYDTLNVSNTDVAGKDIIYNYTPGQDAIYVNKISDVTGLKYDGKSSVVFTLASQKSNANTLTIYGTSANRNTLATDTQITFLDRAGTVYTYTYFDKKATTNLSQLTRVFNPWTPYEKYVGADSTENVTWSAEAAPTQENLNIWHYTSNTWTNNNLDFTISNVFDRHSEELYQDKGIDVKVDLTGARPVGVSVEEPHGNIIEVATTDYGSGSEVIKNYPVVEFTDFKFHAATAVGKNGIHIKGYTYSRFYDEDEYNEDYVVSVGAGVDKNPYIGEYRLADLDGDTTNGYELLKLNPYWKLGQTNKWSYDGDEIQFQVDAGLLDVREYDQTASADINARYAGSPTDFFVDGYNMTVSGGIKANQIKFDPGQAVGDGIDDNGEVIHILGFDTDTTFSITQDTLATTYVLAELDGNTVNGLELLKKNDLWTLTSDGWNYSSGTTKFSINLPAPALRADADGAALDVSVAVHPSLASNGNISGTDSNRGVVLDFSNVELANDVSFSTSLLAFDANVKTGKNGLHVKGLQELVGETGTYESTVKVGNDAYWLVNLDDNLTSDNRSYGDYYNGLELAKVNANWTPVYTEDDGVIIDQNWAYADDDGLKFTISAASEAATVKSGKNAPDTIDKFQKTFDLNDDGSVKYITVGKNSAINITTALTENQTTTIGASDATLAALLPIENITFASDTKTGASGIHIRGYDPGTRLNINRANSAGNALEHVEYQLVDLDGDSGNGLELMAVDSNWTLADGKWSYGDESNGVQFSFDSTSGLAPADIGQVEGVSVTGSTITFDLDSAKTNKALGSLKFTALGEKIGESGIHIKGLAPDVTLKSADNVEENPTLETIYQIVDLDGDTTNGYEVMKVNDQWKLKNGAWSFTNAVRSADNKSTVDSSLEFSISANASIKANTNGIGTPIGIEYSTIVPEDNTKTTIHGLDFSKITNFAATDLSISKASSTQAKVTLTGANGLHITLPGNAATFEGGLAADSRYKIGNDEYQLVDLDPDNAETIDYELMKVDQSWTLGDGAWTYSNSSANINFVINKEAYGASAKDGNDNDTTTYRELYAKDNGIPIGASVSTAGGNVTLSLDDAIDKVSNIEFINAQTGSTNSLHIKGNAALLGQTLTIGGGTQQYRLIDLDSNTNNGYELMKVDDDWTYDPENGSWSYQHDVSTGKNKEATTTTTLAFNLGSTTATRPTDDGIPSGTTVDATNMILQLPKVALEKLTLTTFTPGVNLNSDKIKALHIKPNETITVGTAVTASVGSEQKSYALYDADGNANNGYELTDHGWIPTSVQGSKSSEKLAAFKYKSGTTEYIVSGSAFVGESNFDKSGTTYEDLFGGYDYANIANVTVNTSGALVLNSKNGKETVKWSTARDAFHIKGISDNSTLKVNDQTFTLVNLDGNTANGLELVNNGWVKVESMSADGEEEVTTFIQRDGAFTLNGGADVCINSTKDVDEQDDREDNIPDGISYDSSTKLISFSGNYDDFQGVVISHAKGWSPNVKFNFDDDVHDYALTSETSTTWSIKQTAKPSDDPEDDASGSTDPNAGTGNQLPAMGYDTTGYEVDDLFNYDSSVAIDNELDEIMEIKPLALDSADDFSVDSMLDVRSEISSPATTYSARHRQKK